MRAKLHATRNVMSSFRPFALVLLAFLISGCGRQSVSDIADDQSRYFNHVDSIINSLTTRFEHLEALLGHIDVTNPQWLDAIIMDADEVDNLAAQISQLQAPDTLKDYHQRLLELATELGHASKNLRGGTTFIKNGDGNAAIAAINEASKAMITVKSIVVDLDQRIRTMESTESNPP
jgi:hypothetical protein